MSGSVSIASAENPVETNVDKQAFRSALGHFATGVTVITAQTPGGECIGITANSFNSVSLDPPLILWSLSKSSLGLKLFTDAEYFCVNVLASDQMDISNHFASQQLDKFRDIEITYGYYGTPLIAGCAARFQCKTRCTYEGGDHLIFIGEVMEFDQTSKRGLVYHHGQYAVSEPHPSADGKKTGPGN